MLEHIFELVRRGEVLLFVGAGCSMTAGFPSGREFAQNLFDELKENERQGMQNGLLLPDMAEEFEKRRNRNSLIQMVLKRFDHTSAYMDFHSKLGAIPYFKTIITTNYDRLIETGYGSDECQVLHNDSDCTYLDSNKVHVFKIHGDVTDKERIIVTRGDYNRKTFANDVSCPQLWGIVKAEMVQKNIIFLGYSMGDGNIEEILDNIQKCVGEHQKEMFLLAPGWSNYDQAALMKRGIRYYDIDCIEFIDKLTANIKENAIDDISKGNIDVVKKVFIKNKVSPIIKVENSTNQIMGFEAVDEAPLTALLKFNISKNIAEKLFEPVLSYNPPPIEINKDQLFNFTAEVNGLTVVKPDKLEKVSISHNPTFKGNVDIFFDNGFVYNGLAVKVFGFPDNNMSFTFDTPIMDGSLFDFKYSDNSINFQMTHVLKTKCQNVYMAIHAIELIENMAKGESFQVIGSNVNHHTSLRPDEDILSYILNIKRYYNGILDAQKYFHCTFSNFGNYSKESCLNLSKIQSYITGIGITKNYKGVASFDLTDEDDILKSFPEDETYLIIGINNKEIETLDMYGKKLNIGCCYTVLPCCHIKYIVDDNKKECMAITIEKNTYMEFYHDYNPLFNEFKYILAYRNQFDKIDISSILAVLESGNLKFINGQHEISDGH
ncbi:SIR2 family protein [Parabacteroides sp. AM08-6]|uniref:SIR2 family NAD-dependent protein deacylase n=1 Tax=Parabacteroides sp. AM08-6 TaxID=2292053 RepID=UPI000EFF9F12|nr:SIR2 family protein [Parabacteroides sp. AM08-6]RHJ76378.1 SIR2 family protein [Parabacteroides sp. AM08-6]